MSIRDQGSRWIRRSTRLAIYLRDDYRCVYCTTVVKPGRGTNGKRTRATLDHVLAVAIGGTHAPSNLVTSCRRCNDDKALLSVTAFLHRLSARGVDTTYVAARVRKHTSIPLCATLRAAGRSQMKAGK